MKRFSKEKFLETWEGDLDKDDLPWIDRLDGLEVELFFEDGDGMIGNYFIAFEWMEEDENGKGRSHEN